MTITTLPLSSLILSSLNVRQTERDADVAALAEDIAARGLKQNLVVIPAHFTTGEAKSGWDEKWEVIAGGRRFQAMQLLVAAGRLAADHEVPCLLEDREEASETSLSENLHRVAMNPADEFEAFSKIVADQVRKRMAQADAVAQCAKRFGVTARHVEGRLRLAALAPAILDALRTDRIGIEAAKAYAGTADHAIQLKVFEAREKRGGDHGARYVREELRGRTLPLDHPMVTFVGLVTYQAEGGRIEAEMFMGTDGEQRLVDVALLENLARKIAEAVIPQQAKNDGYKQGLFALGSGYSVKWPAPPKGFVKAWDYGGGLTKADKKKSIALYAIAEDGTGLELAGRFKPEVKQSQIQRDERDWEAERAAASRDRAIMARAAHLTLPGTKGTPLEGRAFYPTWGRKVEDCDDDHSYVVLWIKVPNADIEAKHEEATRQIDAEAAAKLDEEDGADELVTDEAEG